MRFQSLWDRFFLMRPSLFVPVWTFLLLGNHHSLPKIPTLIPSGSVVLALVSYTMLSGGIYILNQLYDRKSDRLNRKLFLIPEGHVGIWSAILQTTVLLAAGIVLSVFFFSRTYLFFVAASVALGIVYSVPPLKLKAKAVFDALANGLGYGFLNLGVGWLAAGCLSPRMLEISLPYVLAVAAVYTSTTILDISGDKKAGDRTTGVWLGPTRASYLSMILMVSSLLVSIVVKNYVCLVASSIALPFFILSAVRVSVRSTLLSVRLGTPVLVVITCILYPLLGCLLAAGFLVTRWYYRNRFGIVYPSILEKDREIEAV